MFIPSRALIAAPFQYLIVGSFSRRHRSQSDDPLYECRKRLITRDCTQLVRFQVFGWVAVTYYHYFHRGDCLSRWQNYNFGLFAFRLGWSITYRPRPLFGPPLGFIELSTSCDIVTDLISSSGIRSTSLTYKLIFKDGQRQGLFQTFSVLQLWEEFLKCCLICHK